jgi:hypothetical protein
MFRRSTWLWSTRAVTPADVKSAFRVMGLQPGATADSVRQRYLQLARENHPDVNGGDDSKMKLVNLAYETVQSHGQTVATTSTSEASAEGPAPRREPNSFKRKWVRTQASEATDHTGWQQRSEFDWAAAVGVTAEERTDGRNHPNAFNKFFSFDDDATLYQQVRSGASTAEAARTLGRTPAQVIKRLDAPQFKLRIQRMLKQDGKGSRSQYRNVVHPNKRVVNPPTSDDMFGSAERHDATAFDARKIASPMGRSYAHLRRFVNKGNR